MKLVLHPEYVKLLSELEELRSQLTELLSMHDELLFHVCKNIEAEYMVKVGSLEFKVFQQECQVLRLKRKIELIQMAINRQEPYDINFIERLLDKEYAEYRQKLNDQAAQLKAAIDRIEAHALSPAETAELKTIYRSLVKRLHPDINPDQSDRERAMFLKVTYAYENGDLDLLRTLDIVTGEIDPISPYTGAAKLDKLRQSKSTLEEKIASVAERIDTIRSTFPYNQKEFLANKDKVKKLQIMLQQRLKNLAETLSQLNRRLHEMEE